MKCYNHEEKNAVGTCTDCSRALCKECITRYYEPLCDKCMTKRLNSNKKHIGKKLIMTAVLFVLGMMMRVEGVSFLLSGLLFASIPWGWDSLNKITPNFFLFMPLGSWFVYFIVKVMLSGMIGIFVMPFSVYKLVNKLKSIHNIEKVYQTD